MTIKILDKYIVKKFLLTFFFMLLIFSAIAIVFDFSEKVDDFISQPVTKMQILKEYYVNFVPWINSVLAPLYALITVVFITSRMAANSEIIAMLSAGISFRRLLLPYFIASSFLALFHLFALHYWVPEGNKTLKAFENRYIFKKNVQSKSSKVHMFISPDTKVFMGYYRKTDSTGLDFKIEKFKDNRLVYLLESPRVQLYEGPNHWRIKDYTIRKIGPIGGESLIIGKGKHIDTTLNLTANDFILVTNAKEMMTTSELNDYIEVQKMKGVGNTRLFEIEKYKRTTEPITIIILTLLGVAIAGRKVRGGMGLHLALALFLGALFIFLTKVSITFATNVAFSPLLGVWIPNIFYGILTAILLMRAQQ